MDHDNPIVFAGDIILMIGWAILVLFVYRYGRFSPWRSERAGIALMGFLFTSTAILTFGIAIILVGVFPGAEEVRLLLYLLLAAASARFLGILIEAQRHERRKKGDHMSIMDRLKSLRREPTLYIGVIAAVANWLVGFNLEWLSAEQAALWMTAINAVAGFVAGFKTRPIPPQAFTYAVTSLAGLGAAYGLDYSQEQVGQFNAMLIAVLALLARGQVSPKNEIEKQEEQDNSNIYNRDEV